MKLYLCRHGETEWSLSGQHTGKSDLPLTAKGRDEARRLRERLKGVHFERVFTSPLQRAQETCEGMGAIVEPLLSEWDYGDYEGLKREEIPADWELFRDGAPNGESPEQVAKRADEFLKKVAGLKGNGILFSHGHFLRVLAARFLGEDVELGKHLALSVASVSILGYDRKEPVIILWNDLS